MRELKPQLAILGGMNMDITARAANALRAGDSVPGQVWQSPGGVGRNVAENLARLGAGVSLLSVVGGDAWGRSLLEQARSVGMDVAGIQQWPDARSSTYMCTLDMQGEVVCAVNDMDVLSRFDARVALQYLQTGVTRAAWVVDCNLPQTALAYILQHAAVPVYADAVSAHKCVRLAGQLHRLHTLKLNAIEAQTLTGLPVSDAASALRAAQALSERGVQRVLLTLGAQGLVWWYGGAGSIVSAPAVAVRSASGAGDALLAGVVFAEAAGYAARRSMEFGMACAALTVQSPDANWDGLTHDCVRSHAAAWYEWKE